MLAADFIAKWKKVELKERSAAQEHFLDLCHLMGHPTPAEDDPTGERFCFEKGAAKHSGGDGWADVWKKDFFGWEYKGKHKDLRNAYDQLLQYRDALASPPLLVVCDLDRIIVHTNFTGTASATHEILLNQLGEPRSREILRNVFFEPDKLRPGQTSQAITQEAAQHFATIADSMRAQGLESGVVAHFLDRVVFCLFAEDIGLLPESIFSKILERSAREPAKFCRYLGDLFKAMGTGGDFNFVDIKHFNGNLFNDASIPELTAEQIPRIVQAAKLDWSAIDPSIFGTLFERGLDPSKRSQLGAHFTSKDDIDTLVDAVIMSPLLREWAESRKVVECLLETGKKNPGKAPTKPLTPSMKVMAGAEADGVIRQFLIHLQSVTILDPACGSGNFLYVALQRLMDLEKAVSAYAYDRGLPSHLPRVSPTQLHGIEINPYAHDLAQMTVWIGWIQWLRSNGFGFPLEPILRPMEDNFRCRDAILDLSDPSHPQEPQWPKVDFIVGNPPFLGGKFLRRELTDEYVNRLLALWRDRVPAEGDLCCYWFEKARAQIDRGLCQRAGLLATQGIRGGANRGVMKQIKDTGSIFWAVSDREWILDGANVHVSMVAFDGGAEGTRTLDGRPVESINANLTATADATQARPLAENENIAFMGTTKGGGFDISEAQALALLQAPNPHGRPNSDVVVPWVNGMDLVQRPKGKWIIDFGVGMPADFAARYEGAFQYLWTEVKPEREKNARESYRRLWWQHVEARPAMRTAFAPRTRFLVTPTISKHRVFVWRTAPTLPDHQLIAFGKEDDYFFGVLHSRLHEVWALKLGTRLETRPRYTPTTCFETFPFPKPTPEQSAAIAAAAQELNGLRERWLNPPEWTRQEVLEFPGTVGGPWDRYIEKTTDDVRTGNGLVRYPRLVPKDAASEAQLKGRTLTQLYNARPAWLDTAHHNLDMAVFAAYGWAPEISDEDLLSRLLSLNLGSTQRSQQ